MQYSSKIVLSYRWPLIVTNGACCFLFIPYFQWRSRRGRGGVTFTGAPVSSCKCIYTTATGAPIYIFGPGRKYPLLRHCLLPPTSVVHDVKLIPQITETTQLFYPGHSHWSRQSVHGRDLPKSPLDTGVHDSRYKHIQISRINSMWILRKGKSCLRTHTI